MARGGSGRDQVFSLPPRVHTLSDEGRQAAESLVVRSLRLWMLLRPGRDSTSAVARRSARVGRTGCGRRGGTPAARPRLSPRVVFGRPLVHQQLIRCSPAGILGPAQPMHGHFPR